MYFIMGLNASVNASTQKTPSEALLGVRLRDSISIKLNIGVDETKPVNAKELRNSIGRHDMGRAPAFVYKEGDLVKITRTNFYNQGKSTKLLTKFTGPYIIVKSLGNDRYKIADISGFNKKRRPFESVVAADKMWPWLNNKFKELESDKYSTTESSDSEYEMTKENDVNRMS